MCESGANARDERSLLARVEGDPGGYDVAGMGGGSLSLRESLGDEGSLLERERVDLIVAPQPFSGRVEHLAVSAGSTIADILAQACNAGGLNLEDRPNWQVYVDGVPLDIPQSLGWRPAAGQVVNIVVRPHGSHNGKDLGQAVLMFAVVIAAIWAGGAVAGKFAEGALAGKIAGAATAAGIYTAGSMIVSSLNRPDEIARANDSYALQDQTNSYRPRRMFPLCLGKRRWAFDVCALPFTTTRGNESYITVGYALHYGPCALEGLKIGETLLADMPAGSVEVEYFLTPGPRNSYLYPSDTNQENLTVKLDPWTSEENVQTAPEGATRIEIDYAHPGGLKFSRTDGKIDYQKVRVRADKAPVGTETWTLGQQIDSSARTNDPIRKMLAFNVDPGTQWKVRIVASIQPPYDDDPTWSKQYSTDGTILTAFRTFSAGRPVLDETLACVFLRIRATSNLSGALPTVTGVVTPRAPVWDADEQAWTAPATTFVDATWPTTQCAAALARYMLCSYPAANPLTADQIDDSFGAQAELIAAKGWDGCALITEDASQQQALGLLEQLGRFFVWWDGSRMICVPDWEKPAPVQMFTVRNAENYAYERSFPDPIHAVVVEFENTDKDSAPDEAVVYMDGYAALAGDGKLAATLYQAFRFPIAISGERAQREGRRFLAKHVHQVETHDWTAGRDGLRAARGDRVKVRHYATLIGMADGRVQFRRWTGGLIAGVRIDTPVTMTEGTSYVIEVRRGDGLLSIPVVTTPGQTRDLVFAAPLETAVAPQKGSLFAFGEVDAVTEDVEIVDISVTDGGFALKGVNYVAPQLIEAEEGSIPPFISQVKARPQAPTPRIVDASGSPAGAVVVFDIDPLRGAVLTGFSARWRVHDDDTADTNPWQRLAPLAPNERTVITPPVSTAALSDSSGALALKVDVELTSQITTGEVSDAAYALGISLTDEVAAKPREGVWTVSGTTFDGASGDKTPGILIVGACDVADADGILVSYRLVGAADWTSLPSASTSATKFEIRGLEGEGAYDVQIAYSRAGRPGDARLYTPIVVGAGRAADTVNLDGRPGSQVNETLDGLIETYGDTASAASSASIASDAADLAQTAKDQAQAAFADAAGSASSAASSAAISATANSGALKSALVTLPSTFEADGLYFTGAYSSNVLSATPPDLPPDTRVTFQTVTGEGRVVQDAGTGVAGGNYVAQKGYMKLAPGATYRVTTRSRTTVSGGTDAATVFLAVYDSTGAYLSGRSKSVAATTVAAGWVTQTTEWTADELLAYSASVTYLRAFILVSNSASTRQLSRLQFQDVTSEKAALAAATASQTSASAAAAWSDEAGDHADAAATEAALATTKAGEASASAGSAASSEATTLGYLNSASSYATVAAKNVLKTWPSTFQEDSRYFTNDTALTGRLAGTALADIPTTGRYAFVTDATEGRVIQDNGGAGGPWVATKGYEKITTGRSYRVTARTRTTVGGTQNLSFVGINVFNATGTSLAQLYISTTAQAAGSGWAEFSYDTTATAILASYPTATYFVPMVWLSRGTETRQMSVLRYTDRTEAELAAESASAAVDSASTATAKATEAGASANAASGFSVTASTKAGDALASQISAADSAADAASASTASGLSATYSRIAALNLLPDRVSQRAYFSRGTTSGLLPENLPNLEAAGSVETSSSEGQVWQFAGNGSIISCGWLPVETGRSYTADARAALVTNVTAGTASFAFGMAIYSATGAYLGAVSNLNVSSPWTVAQGWLAATRTTTAALILAAFPTAKYVRPVATFGLGTGGVFQFSTMRLRDTTESANAAGSASAASGFSTNASNAAASAQGYMTLSARMGGAAFNSNPLFADFPTTPGLPTGWSTDPLNATGNRVANPAGGYGYQMTGGAGASAYVAQTIPTGIFSTSQYVVVEVDARLDSGALTGAGFQLGVAGGANTLTLAQPFSTLPDMSDGAAAPVAVGAGTVGRTYRFRKMVKVTNSAPTTGALYVMAHYSTLGSIAAANQITFFKALARAATPAEIAVGLVLPDVQADATYASAAVTNAGGLLAYHKFTAAAGGNEAKVEIVATGTDAIVQAIARKVSLVAETGDTPTAALILEGDKATLYGNFRATGKIKYGSGGAGWPVGGAAVQYSLSDGQYVAFGINFPAPPKVIPDKSGTGLATLSGTEEYRIYAEVTEAGMTARIRKLTPGSPTAYICNTQQPFSTGPQFQRDKGLAGATIANDGYYTFNIALDYDYQYLGPSDWHGYYNDIWGYSASGSLWVYNGGWVEVGTWLVGDEQETPGTIPSSGSTTVSVAAFYSSAIANGSGNEFGISVNAANGVTVTALSSVDFTGAGSSGESTATPSGQKVTFTVFPPPEVA